LLEKFGSLAGVKSATIEELKNVQGLSTAMATRIFETLHKD
jgi:excinuclease UvrABC nuclease subunit